MGEALWRCWVVYKAFFKSYIGPSKGNIRGNQGNINGHEQLFYIFFDFVFLKFSTLELNKKVNGHQHRILREISSLERLQRSGVRNPGDPILNTILFDSCILNLLLSG